MLTRIVVSGLFAGFAAGVIAALLQLAFVQPVLLHAELYESGVLVHFGAEAVPALQDVGGIAPVRDALSLLFTALVYTGYAMILIGAMALAASRGWVTDITARSGIIWGAAGFVTFHFAPAISLPPELPGVAAADLVGRQAWWLGTVLATAVAMMLIAFGRNWAAWGGAIVLLLAPHVIGAPQPETFAGPVPPELGAEFAARALGVGMAAWVLLGLFAGYFWQREGRQTEQLAHG